ncbi:hypothetical protein ACNF42_08145 [Cuniculiplasma sp. SKW3]|uniref:hypothetical protein n=1 Tax=Cuniculiplasma sp. SKW3 TaxID=3400170 RepID=UPI003FD4DF64
MNLNRSLLEITAIIIAVMFLGPGIQPAIVHNNHLASASVITLTAGRHLSNINHSNLMIERSIIMENRMVDVKQIAQNIGPKNISVDKILCWTDEIGPNNSFILSFNQENTERLITYMTLLALSGVGFLVSRAAPVIAGFLGISADALLTAFSAVIAIIAITAIFLQLIDAMGGFQGIYFGVGYSNTNLWFTTVTVPYPLLNTNPAPGFEPIVNQCI